MRGENLYVILGDDIIGRNVVSAVDAIRRQGRGARILLKQVADPGMYGVPRFQGGRIPAIDERPAALQST